MLRRFADSVFRALLSRFPADQAHPRTSLERSGMPETVVRYLVRALDTRLEVELGKFKHLESAWFELEHPDVRAAMNDHAAVLARHGQFPADEWQPALERAVRNVVSYHARPGRTLVEFLFARESDEYTIDGLRQKLDFFQSYPELDDMLEQHVREQRTEAINRDSVLSLVRGIDQRLEAAHNTEAWLTLLDPLFEIASVLPEYENVVPVELAISFFRDKGVGVVERHLERMHEEEGVDVLRRDELELILEARTALPEAEPGFRHDRVIVPGRPAPMKPSDGATMHDASPERVTPPVAESHVMRGPVPLWQQFHQGRAESTQPLHRVHIRREVPRPEVSGEAQPIWRRFSEDNQPTPGRSDFGATEDSLSRLERIVLGEHVARAREQFVRALFRGSEGDYHATLTRLENARSWTEASRIIANDVFRRNQVDIYSDSAVSFTNAVEARFQDA